MKKVWIILILFFIGLCFSNDLSPYKSIKKNPMKLTYLKSGIALSGANASATKELMGNFYKEMKTQPNYATALKEAKLEMIKQNMHPFFWAAFVVNGL